MVVHVAERVADQLDGLVPISDDVGNRVLADNARLVRWAAPLFTGCAALLLPWIVIAGITLPSRSLSRKLRRGLGRLRRDPVDRADQHRDDHAAPVPPAADRSVGHRRAADRRRLVRRAHHPGGWGLVEAMAMSLLAELPLAAICFWLAWHSQEMAEQRLVLLIGRHGAG